MKKRGQVVTPVDIRLRQSTIVDSKTDCWNWQKSKTFGYGRMVIGSRTDKTRRAIGAHRAAYLAFIGPIPEGMEVCHHCDNPSCCNPAHLFVGTRQDNIDDRERKGRNNPPKGVSSPHAKLDDAKVINIRELHKSGWTHRSLAKLFHVNKSTVTKVLLGKTWTHVCSPAAPKK